MGKYDNVPLSPRRNTDPVEPCKVVKAAPVARKAPVANQNGLRSVNGAMIYCSEQQVDTPRRPVVEFTCSIPGCGVVGVSRTMFIPGREEVMRRFGGIFRAEDILTNCRCRNHAGRGWSRVSERALTSVAIRNDAWNDSVREGKIGELMNKLDRVPAAEPRKAKSA